MNLKMFRNQENYSLKEAVITLLQTAINFTIMKQNHSISCISEVKMTPPLFGQNCQKIIADLTIQLLYLQWVGQFAALALSGVLVFGGIHYFKEKKSIFQ